MTAGPRKRAASLVRRLFQAGWLLSQPTRLDSARPCVWIGPTWTEGSPNCHQQGCTNSSRVGEFALPEKLASPRVLASANIQTGSESFARRPRYGERNDCSGSTLRIICNLRTRLVNKSNFLCFALDLRGSIVSLLCGNFSSQLARTFSWLWEVVVAEARGSFGLDLHISERAQQYRQDQTRRARKSGKQATEPQ